MYKYEEQRPYTFSDEGSRTVLRLALCAQYLYGQAGAVSLGALIGHLTGDSWHHTACVDRLVELGYLREVQQGPVAGQDRIFTWTGRAKKD